MNQILDFGVGGGNEGNNNRKEKKTSKKERKEYSKDGFGGIKEFGGGSAGGTKSISDKVIKVFALLMVILAIALIISGVTSLMGNDEKAKENKNAASTTTQKIEADIIAELNEISGKVKITVDSPITIDNVKYSWDHEHDNVVSGEKQTTCEIEVLAPNGEHTLYVIVTDEQKNETKKEFTFNSATGIDTEKPEIKLTITEGAEGENKKLEVKATDDTSIAYVTYSWNEGETITMTPENAGTQEYEFVIDIPRGKNTIVVTAVDGSDSSNARVESKVIEAKTNPEITYGFLDNEGSALKIMCSHESGIKKIYYTLNGQPYQWELEEGSEAPKYLEFEQQSVQGHNEIVVKVTSVDDTTADFTQAWDYGVTATADDSDDTVKPEIALTAKENGKLEISVKDNTAIKTVSYVWNEEQPVEMTVEGQPKEYTFEIEVAAGTNKLKVTATDAKGNQETIENTINAVSANN